MTKDSDYLKNDGKVQFDTFTMHDPAISTNILAIAAEETDYAKKSLDGRLAFVEKLLGAKSFDSAIQIQSEYAKSFFDGFVAQATKMGELYSSLAKLVFKPFGGAPLIPKA